MFFIASPVMADMFVNDVDPPNSDSNPQLLTNSGDAAEEEWLEGLLGLTYDDPSVEYIIRYETSSYSGVTPPNGTQYYILKFGGGQGNQLPDHYAFEFDGNGVIDPISAYSGITETNFGLSHISFFDGDGDVPQVPIPAPIFLLGTGLVGLAGLRRNLRK